MESPSPSLHLTHLAQNQCPQLVCTGEITSLERQIGHSPPGCRSSRPAGGASVGIVDELSPVCLCSVGHVSSNQNRSGRLYHLSYHLSTELNKKKGGSTMVFFVCVCVSGHARANETPRDGGGSRVRFASRPRVIFVLSASENRESS